MKKHKKSLLILATISFLGINAYAQSTYFTWGDAKMDRGKLIYQPDASSVVIAGETEGSQNKELFLINTSLTGKVNWYKTFSGTVSYAINDWTITKDGGYMLSAEQYIQNDRETLYLIKLDNKGNIQWEKFFNEGGNEIEGRSIIQTNDGGYMITGYIKVATMAADIFYPIKQEKGYMYILKTDNKGNKEWSKKVAYERDPGANGAKVIETTNGFLLGGTTGDTATQNSDVFLTHIDKKGNFLWSKIYLTAGKDNINNMTIIDNDVYIIGGTKAFGAGKTDAFAMRVSATGDVIWQKTFGGPLQESISTIVKTNDNTLLLAGETQSFGKGIYDLFILTVDLNGNLLTSETFGESNHEEMGSAIVNGNQVLMTGFSFASTTQKSIQAFCVSFNLNEKSKKCFFENANVIVKNNTIGIATKELSKQIISDITASDDNPNIQHSATAVKNQSMTTEIFCK